MVVVVTQWQFSLNPNHIQITQITSIEYEGHHHQERSPAEKRQSFIKL